MCDTIISQINFDCEKDKKMENKIILKVGRYKTFYVTRIRLYSYLLEHGIKPIFHRPDRRDELRVVWGYSWTQQLESALRMYYSERHPEWEIEVEYVGEK